MARMPTIPLRVPPVLLGVLLVPRLVSADVIHLRSGNSVEVQTWRRAADSVEYYRFGGLVTVRSFEVLRIDAPRKTAEPTPEAAVAPAPASTPFGEITDAHLLDRALRALSAGDVESFVSHFRYVGDPKWPDEGPGLTRVFSLLRDRLGRPDDFTPVTTTTPRFVNFWVESAHPDEWRRSDCLFKGYAYRTTLVEGKVRRPVEVIVDVCQAWTARRSWLRKVDVRFLQPDPKVVRTVQELTQAVQAAARAGVVPAGPLPPVRYPTAIAR